MRWQVGVTPSYMGGSTHAVVFDPQKPLNASGVLYFIVEAESENEAAGIGELRYQRYREESSEIAKRHAEEHNALARKYKLLGFHE